MDHISRDITSPKGVFLWPRLNTPEIPDFPGYDGPPLYSVNLRVKDKQAQPLMNQIDEMFDENLVACKKEFGARKCKPADKPYVPEYDKDTDEETGYILFKFKLPSEVTRKRDKKVCKLFPKLFDARGNPTSVEVGGGTVGRISMEARGWYMGATKMSGIKLSLKAAQILELHQWDGGTADSFGFDEVEDGWTTPASKSGFSEDNDADDDPDDAPADDDDIPF